MKLLRSPYLKAACGALVLLAVGSFGAYQHARYYTGDVPGTVSCLSCHVEAQGLNPLDLIRQARYVSPNKLKVAPDGSHLVITGRDSDSLLVVDLDSRRVKASIPVGRHPFDVALTSDAGTAFVSNEWSDSISVVDLARQRVVRTIPAGSHPSGLALTPDQKTLFVAEWQSDILRAIDVPSGTAKVQLAGGGSPNQLAITPGGDTLLATNQVSYLSSDPKRPPRSEITVVDVHRLRTQRRIALDDAHLLEGITVLPQGDLALATLVKPKNLLPLVQVERGWVMNNGLGIVDLATGSCIQLLLDEVNDSFADPFDIASTPDGRLAFVSHTGVNRVSVIDVDALRSLLAKIRAGEITEPSLRLDLSSRFVLRRIETRSNPAGLAVSPDGRTLFVAERLNDSILAVSLESMTEAFRIRLGGSEHESAVRRGERLFNDATRTFQGQFSCRSCHPRNHQDGLRYDFEPDGLGVDFVDNRSLLGIRDTAPYKWNGKNTSLFMQCGMRFARILTRVNSFQPDELSALVAYLRSLPAEHSPYLAADGTLTPHQAKGKAFFERSLTKDGVVIPESNRCITCHPPPLYTNRKRADVGSGSPTDTSTEFDTPHLTGIFGTAPYLHDGKARTLEEIWTLYNAEDTHGVTRDMSNQDLNDLIEYLKTF